MIRTQPHRGGWLEVVCGPMFSGKSEELIRRLRRAEIAGQKALIVKPAVDDRYDVGHVVSHAGAKMRAVTARSGAEVARLSTGYDAVGIDEVQFFDDGIVEAITAIVARGARVVAAGLAQDFRGEPFGSMPTASYPLASRSTCVLEPAVTARIFAPACETTWPTS